MRCISTIDLKDNRIRLTWTTSITMTARTRLIQLIERMDNMLRRNNSMQPSRQKRKQNQTIQARQINSETYLWHIWSQSKQLQHRPILQIARKSSKKRHNSTNLNNLTTKTLKYHRAVSMSFNRNHNQQLKHKVLKRGGENLRSRLNLRKILKKRRKRKHVTLIQINLKTTTLLLDL